MAWDWKRRIGQLFGLKAAKQKETARTVQDPVLLQRTAQIDAGTHRACTSAEIHEVIETARDLKEVTRNNIIVLHALSHASPKADFKDVPEIAPLALTLTRDLQAPYNQSVDALVALNSAANDLERFSARAQSASGEKPAAGLPVCDSERLLIIGLAGQLTSIYKAHHAASKLVKEVSGFLDLPDAGHLQKALQDNRDKLPALGARLTRMTLDTLGKSAPSPQASPSKLALS